MLISRRRMWIKFSSSYACNYYLLNLKAVWRVLLTAHVSYVIAKLKILCYVTHSDWIYLTSFWETIWLGMWSTRTEGITCAFGCSPNYKLPLWCTACFTEVRLCVMLLRRRFTIVLFTVAFFVLCFDSSFDLLCKVRLIKLS